MKKTLILFIIVLLGIFTFVQNENQGQKEDLIEELPRSIEKPKKVVKKIAHEEVREEVKKPLSTLSSSNSSPRQLTDKEIEEMDILFSEYEQKWDQRMEDLFLKELKLSKTDFEDYQLMRDGFEEDRIAAYEEFHQSMLAEHGDEYSYPPTLEMVDNERKIQKDYLDLFKSKTIFSPN